MGFGFLLAGAIFLFDPFINIFDILPDVIGYALIVYGLSRLSDLAIPFSRSERYSSFLSYARLSAITSLGMLTLRLSVAVAPTAT